MIGLDNIIILGSNAILAWCVSMVAVVAAARIKDGHRNIRFAKATFALFYSCAYWWLLFNLEHRAEWSRYMVIVGLVSWPVGWAASDLIALQVEKRRERKLAEMIERVGVVDDGG